ncbi:MAG: cytochrome b N-terminal domain-containing protein [Anaerolineales bacterium]|nr:cytochrome b N-terminal domain-containing protein [Anaerolineales bacterium]
MTTLDPRPESLPQRVAESIQRDKPFSEDERDRMKAVMNSLLLHIHASKVPARSLKFTYTFGLGGLSLLLIMMLIVTGIMLMFVYTPSPDSAYTDMLALQSTVAFGQLIRNLHHWSGNLLLVVVFLHMLRVFYTGAFRHPREFNWVIGVGLLLLVVMANFTGYLLPWDQLAYWAVTVGTSLLDYVPVVGEQISLLILGGPEVSGATLRNFYGLHLAIVPMMILMIVSVHIFRVRRDVGTVPRNLDEEPLKRLEKVTTLPHLVSREAVFAIVMIGLILLWSTWVNAPLEEAANPDHSPNPAKAAWYFMGLQELLLHFHPFFAAIVIPALALGGLMMLPYLRTDMDTEGVWFRSRMGRKLAWIGFFTGLIATPLLVLLDEYVVNLPDLLPSLPTIISNGWVPLAGILLLLILYAGMLKRVFHAASCEVRQSVFTLLLTGFIVLTIIGIAFRGEGMALMWPWEV